MKLVFTLLAVVALCSAARIGGYNSEPKGYAPLPSLKRSMVQSGEMTVVLALRQRNTDILEQKFWAVSDPHNPDYGKHMSFQQVIDLVAPLDQSINSVINWMTESGIDRSKIILRQSRDFLNVDLTADQVESLFQAPLTAYVHKKRGTVGMRMDSGYELPASVEPLVDFVSDFLQFKKRLVVGVPPESPASRRSAPRAVTSNAPVIIEPSSLDGGVAFSVFVYCLDKSIPSISGGGTSLTCGGITLTGLSATIKNTISGQSTSPLTLRNPQCTLCGSDDRCKLTNLDQNAVLCSFDGIGGLTNYLPYQVTMATVWSTGTSNTVSVTLQPSEAVTPTIITRTYGIPAGTVVTQSNNNQSVIEFSENFSLTDAQQYFSMFDMPDYTNLIELFNTVNTNDPGSGEGILDVVAIMGTARNCVTVYWEETNDSSAFLKWIQDVLNHPTPPLVQSVSYGNQEIASSASNSDARINTEFIKAGVRGMTLIVSSGDNGAVATPSQTAPAFEPDFPATSPYVTSVGATMFNTLTPTQNCYNTGFTKYTCGNPSEIAASPADGALVSSGGGFSNIFDIPSYQSTVVAAYLAQTTTTGFNRSGRGYPDVSALGHNIQIIHQGEQASEDGTSASAPFFAGMVTLWNDIRLKNGESPLGFLNPFLYNLTSDHFNDVTKGSNKCQPDNVCSSNGFDAVIGWDPVTGLGTPIWNKIATAVGGLPANPTTTTSSNPTSTASSNPASTTSSNPTSTTSSSVTSSSHSSSSSATSSSPSSSASTQPATTRTSSPTQSSSTTSPSSASCLSFSFFLLLIAPFFCL